jgi:hypothetical protein
VSRTEQNCTLRTFSNCMPYDGVKHFKPTLSYITFQLRKISFFLIWKWTYLFSLRWLLFSVFNKPVKWGSGFCSCIKLHSVLKSVTKKAVQIYLLSFHRKLQKWSNNPLATSHSKKRCLVLQRWTVYANTKLLRELHLKCKQLQNAS